MHLAILLAVGLLPALPYARSIPSRRGVDCSFYTSPDSGATCASFADAWGTSEDDLKALNSGIMCPYIDREGTYCVIGSVNDDPDEPSPTAVGPKSTVPASTKMTSGIKTTATPVNPPLPSSPLLPSSLLAIALKPQTLSRKGILNYNKISLAEFFKWNPAVGKDCTGLWADINALLTIIRSPFADFIKWNPAVGKDCSGLWKNTNAYVGVIGSTPSPTTAVKPSPTVTTPANGIKTPSPIQDGTVSNCNKWHFIKDTTTCQGIIDYNKITLADFIKWNPAVGKDCSGLWKGTNACVGVVGSKPQPTATTPNNGVKTPLPIQEGMVKNCVKFHYISSSTKCQALLKYDKITIEQFFK
ncbi:hypothetical protein ACHAP5_012184 [Fusarium lateritium]